MARLPRIEIGDIVEVAFLDHAEGSEELKFRVYGQISQKDRVKIVIDTWCPFEEDEDDAGGMNRHQFTILRSTILELHKLQRKTNAKDAKIGKATEATKLRRTTQNRVEGDQVPPAQ